MLDIGDFLATRRLAIFLRRTAAACAPVFPDAPAVAAWLRGALPGEPGAVAAGIAEAQARALFFLHRTAQRNLQFSLLFCVAAAAFRPWLCRQLCPFRARRVHPSHRVQLETMESETIELLQFNSHTDHRALTGRSS